MSTTTKPSTKEKEKEEIPFRVPEPGQHLTETQVAHRLQVTTSTVRHWRSEGRGPNYLKIGGKIVRYRLSDIEEFESARYAFPNARPARSAA